MKSFWTQVDELRKTGETLKATLGDMGWDLIQSDRSEYRARKRGGIKARRDGWLECSSPTAKGLLEIIDAEIKRHGNQSK